MRAVLSPFALAKPLAGLLAVLALIFAVAPSPASAVGTGAIHCKGVTVSSGELELSGVLANAEDLEGALRVKATRKGRKPYFLLKGDLVSKGSIEHRLGPGHVKITNLEFAESALPFDPKKGKGRWRAIPVAVKDVHFAGEYKGRLELGSGGCKVDLSVVVAGPADVSLVGTGEKAVKLKLARCRHFTCGPGDFLAGLNSPSSRRDEVEVQVNNASQAPAEVTAVQVALNSDPGEEIVPKDAFAPPEQAFTLPAQHAKALPAIGIDRGEIDPGHYTGAIYLTVAGGEKRIGLPFELDLKEGPFWALVALIAALFVQLLVALSSLMHPRKQGLSEVRALRKKARSALGVDAPLLERRLNQARDLARDGKLAPAKAECTKIDADIGRLQSAQGLEKEAKEKGDGSLPADVAAMLADLRAAVSSGSDDTGAKLSRLKRAVEAMDSEEMAGASMASMATMARIPRRAAREGRLDREVDRGAQKLRNVARRVAKVIKTEFEHLAHAVTWISIYVLPWLLRGLLVAVFLLTGLKELYFSNATFGAQAVIDYGGLFLWGLTAAAFNTVLGKIVPGAGKD